jgi:hypothetical protein
MPKAKISVTPIIYNSKGYDSNSSDYIMPKATIPIAQII